MATRSPEATIDFLLTCIECTEAKPNWDEVALKTGWYKGGKFSRQAFIGIQKKYAGTEIGGANVSNGKAGEEGKGSKSTTPKITPKTTPKKRAAEDGDVNSSGTKKAKKEEVRSEGDGDSGVAKDENGDAED